MQFNIVNIRCLVYGDDNAVILNKRISLCNEGMHFPVTFNKERRWRHEEACYYR